MKVIVAVLLLLLLSPAALPAQAAPASGWVGGTITSGDLLKVTVLREPLLTFEQTVPVDGLIDFHRVGRRDVRGMTGEALREELAREYTRYLVDPTVRVEVLRKVQVLGAVRAPGVYMMHPTLTISDAIAMAGGTMADGRADRVELRREGEVLEVLLLSRDNSMLADTPIRSGDQLFVPERHFMARNFGVMTTAVYGVLALLVTLAVR
jgi:protein involved in polysaccharide export with SLBB domain